MLKLMFLNMSSLIHMAMQRLYFHFQIKYLYLKGSAVYRNKNFCPLCHVWAAFAWILTIHKFWPSVYNVCARRAAELRPVHGDMLHRGPAQDPHRRQESPGQDQVQQREHLQVGEINKFALLWGEAQLCLLIERKVMTYSYPKVTYIDPTHLLLPLLTLPGP